MQELFSILEEIHPEIDFRSASDFIAEGIIDSFDIVTIVTGLEEKLGIMIAGEDVTPENFKSVECLENLIKKYI